MSGEGFDPIENAKRLVLDRKLYGVSYVLAATGERVAPQDVSLTDASYLSEEEVAATFGIQWKDMFPHNWKPIDSAPQDGTKVLIWQAPWHQACEGYCLDQHPHAGEPEGWFTGNHQKVNPTHWQEKPSPPTIPALTAEQSEAVAKVRAIVETSTLATYRPPPDTNERG